MQVQQQHHIRDSAIRVASGAIVGGVMFGLGGKVPAALVGIGIGATAGLAGSFVGKKTEIGIGVGGVLGAIGGITLANVIKQIPAIKSTSAAIAAGGVAGVLAGIGAAVAIGLLFPPDAGEGARLHAPAPALKHSGASA